MIEELATVEHFAKVLYSGHIPLGQVNVESSFVFEKTRHIRDGRGVPIFHGNRHYVTAMALHIFFETVLDQRVNFRIDDFCANDFIHKAIDRQPFGSPRKH